jgi:hypothetical protein
VFKITDIADSGDVSIQELGFDGMPIGDVLVKDGPTFATAFKSTKVQFEEMNWLPIYAKDNKVLLLQHLATWYLMWRFRRLP